MINSEQLSCFDKKDVPTGASIVCAFGLFLLLTNLRTPRKLRSELSDFTHPDYPAKP